MANLLARVRVMIGDTLPSGSGQIFSDLDIQNVMDETRADIGNLVLEPYLTYSGSTVQYLDYYAPNGINNLEDDVLLKQYRVTLVTPSVSENILGHWSFAVSTLPPVYISSGKSYDLYRSAADLLERWSAQWAIAYDFSSDSQSFHRSQASAGLQKLAHTFRLKQRAHSLDVGRSDFTGVNDGGVNLQPREIDYF